MKILLITALFMGALIINYGFAGQFIVSRMISSDPQVNGKVKEQIWKQAEETKIRKNGIQISVQSFYNKKNIYMNISLMPDKALKNPQLEIFIKPLMFDNRSKVLTLKNLSLFTIAVDKKGVISSDYDGKINAWTQETPENGFIIELELPIPENMYWERTMPQAGEYYEFACRLNDQTLRKQEPLYFFINHRNGLKGNMSKLLFCGQWQGGNAALFFDMNNVYKPLLEKLAKHITELKRLKYPQTSKKFAESLKKWNIRNNSFSEVDYLEQRFFQLKSLEELVRESREKLVFILTKIIKEKSRQALLLPHPCWEDNKLPVPDTLPAAEDIKQKGIGLKACPDEQTAFSALLWAPASHDNVTFELMPFVDGNGQEVAVHVDKYFVKCWYQGGRFEITHSGKKLIPELLLKNPDLVQVDYLKKDNILKSHGRSGIERKYPNDSKTLQPIRILPAEFAQQLWINVKFPSDAGPGAYKSELVAKSSGAVIAQLPVSIQILDFKLDRSPLRNQIYTYSQWGDKNDELVLAEIKSLTSHGIDTVGLFEKTKNLKRVVELMRRGGLSTDRIYLQGDGDHYIWSDMTLQKIEQKVERAILELKDCDIKEVYFYLPDEARGERLRKSVEIAETIRKCGGKTWGAAHRGWYDIAGKSFDHVNMSGSPLPREEVDKVHRDGHEIFCYNFPQGGAELPETFRRNFGLTLWCAGYDGGMTWAWWWPFGREQDAWNDFDHNFFRDHCMVYPTVDGVVSTIQFEGYLKGINDTRYLGTLLNLIKQIPENDHRTKEMETYLKDLKDNRSVHLEDLEKVRNELIDRIEICKKILEEPKK